LRLGASQIQALDQWLAEYLGSCQTQHELRAAP
jgi:hypothetical protein